MCRPVVVPGKFLHGRNISGRKEGKMGEAQILRFQEDILNEHVGRAGVVEETADVCVPRAIYDVGMLLAEHLVTVYW